MDTKFLPEELGMYFLLSSWAVADYEEVELFTWGSTGIPIICQGQNLHQNQLAPELPLFEDRNICCMIALCFCLAKFSLSLTCQGF